jgi:hypothetical protein
LAARRSIAISRLRVVDVIVVQLVLSPHVERGARDAGLSGPYRRGG